jgi:hypothetical protein
MVMSAFEEMIVAFLKEKRDGKLQECVADIPVEIKNIISSYRPFSDKLSALIDESTCNSTEEEKLGTKLEIMNQIDDAMVKAIEDIIQKRLSLL